MVGFLRGKRTYLVALLMFVAAILKALDLLPAPAYEALMGLLTALGFGALRAGMEKTVVELERGERE